MEGINLSIIIPVYNAEKYVSISIESVLKQMTEKMELIVVDDGSTDASGIICDQYSCYENIHVIHKINGGAPSARNVGIDNARGAYISFLDADDYVDKATYATVLSIINEHDVDLIDYGYRYVTEYGEKFECINKLPKNEVLNKSFINDVVLPPLLNLKRDDENFIYDFSVNKIYKKEILNENGIRFDESRRTWEDRIFLVEYLKYCNSIFSLNECFYNYISVPNSLSRRYDAHYFEIILKNYRRYKELFGKQYDFETDYVNNYWCKAIENKIINQFKFKDKKIEVVERALNILDEPEVKEWYIKRCAENELQNQTKEAMILGDKERVVKLYQKVAMQIEMKDKRAKLVYLIKKLIKKTPIKRIVLKINDFIYVKKRYKYLKKNYGISIMTPEDTIDYIKNNNCSIARFGDGEMELMLQQGGPEFQKGSNEIKQALLDVFANESSKLLTKTSHT